MAIELPLDSLLLERVFELSGEPTLQAAVNLALSEFVARREQKRMSELFGQFDWNAGYDYKAERDRPRQG